MSAINSEVYSIYKTNLCVFLNSGKTFSFKNVVNLVSNESMLAFNYTAVSDRQIKKASFAHSNIAGFSTYMEEV
jgi:hypothetical protein